MKTKKYFFLILLILPMFFSCKFLDYDLTEAFHRLMKVELRAQGIELITTNAAVNSIGAEDEYDVLIITDIHFGNENKGLNGPRREDEWFAKLNTVNTQTGKSLMDTTKFVICLGDIAEHGLESETLAYKAAIVDVFEAKGISVFNVVGNHDLYNSGWTQWSNNLYPGTSFYKFETPSFSWYFLDSASGTLGGFQYEEMDKTMSKDPKDKLVFTHIPLYAENHQYFVMQNTDERNKIINTCAKYFTKKFVDGHTHVKRTSNFGKFTEHNIPGFLSKYGYAVLHVNEKNKKTVLNVHYY